VSYFTAIRVYSLFELSLFAALVAVAVGGWSEEAKLALGWSHGVGWILLCALVGLGAARGTFTWVVLAATVSPAGPLGSTIGIEWMARRRRASATASAAPPDAAAAPARR
jgi:uncharacterized membrane protein